MIHRNPPQPTAPRSSTAQPNTCAWPGHRYRRPAGSGWPRFFGPVPLRAITKPTPHLTLPRLRCCAAPGRAWLGHAERGQHAGHVPCRGVVQPGGDVVGYCQGHGAAAGRDAGWLRTALLPRAPIDGAPPALNARRLPSGKRRRPPQTALTGSAAPLVLLPRGSRLATPPCRCFRARWLSTRSWTGTRLASRRSRAPSKPPPLSISRWLAGMCECAASTAAPWVPLFCARTCCATVRRCDAPWLAALLHGAINESPPSV